MTNPDIARVSNLFEPLLFWNNNYELEPALAESVEGSKDAKTWTIKMRQGVTFHNGKDVTADDAWFSLQRVADPKAPLSGGGQLSQILDFEASKVVDPTTLQLVLKVPYALLDSLLAEYTVGIIPTDFDIANPVGTGAFAYKSFDPGKTSTFTKYADYWGDAAFVDELQIQDFSDDSAKVNALQAGQIQTVDNLPYNLIDTIEGAGGGALVSETGAWVPFTMRVDSAPFSDVRVRQAMRLIVDRQQMIDQTLSGYGSLGNDMYAPFDVAYASDLPQRSRTSTRPSPCWPGGILIHGATGGGSKDTLDPHAPVTTLDIARVSNLFEPLLFWNNAYEAFEPALAESVESSPDGTKWTIKMRQGVTFHNGKDVTAEDAWFSIQRVADPKAPLSGGGQLRYPRTPVHEGCRRDHARTRAEGALRDPRRAAGGVHRRHHPDRLRHREPRGHRRFRLQVLRPRQDQHLHQVRRLLGRPGLRRRNPADPGLP